MNLFINGGTQHCFTVVILTAVRSWITCFCEVFATTLFIFLLINRGTLESMVFEICSVLGENSLEFVSIRTAVKSPVQNKTKQNKNVKAKYVVKGKALTSCRYKKEVGYWICQILIEMNAHSQLYRDIARRISMLQFLTSCTVTSPEALIE